MQQVQVSAQGAQYDIFIGKGLIPQAGDYLRQWQERKAAVICDSNVEGLYADTLLSALKSAGIHGETIVVPSGEKSKSHEMLLKLYSSLVEMGITRKDCVVALGGGVVGDLAGFAAATYMRGVPLVQVPTTLLAQVDSSVGGKVAVNLPEGKNMVGSFYQPSLVLADTDTLNTLDHRQWAAGMAEVIKYGAIYDSELFEELERSADESSLQDRMEGLVARCCAIKAEYVRQDPLDTGIRMELNFGHTLGHALENTLGYGVLLHGEGVSIGMMAASHYGEETGVTPKGTAERLKAVLEAVGLPVTLSGASLDAIEESMGRDKKSAGDTVRLVLLTEMGKATVVPVRREELGRLAREVLM